MFSMSAFADTDIGTGYDIDVGAGSRDWGINYWTSGYRMYMEGPEIGRASCRERV